MSSSDVSHAKLKVVAYAYKPVYRLASLPSSAAHGLLYPGVYFSLSPKPSPYQARAPPHLDVLGRLARSALRQQDNGVLARDLPSGLVLVELLADTRGDTDHDVRLDRSERGHGRRARLRGERADRNVEGRVERGVAVVREFSVVEVSLENNQVRLGEVLEQIGGFRMQVPLAVSSALFDPC